MDDAQKELERELKLVHMQRDIDILKLQMGEFKQFAEKANSFFYTMQSFQTQLEDFDNRFDERLELFSVKLENKFTKEIAAVQTNIQQDKEEKKKDSGGFNSDWIKVIQYILMALLGLIALLGSLSGVKLPF